MTESMLGALEPPILTFFGARRGKPAVLQVIKQIAENVRVHRFDRESIMLGADSAASLLRYSLTALDSNKPISLRLAHFAQFREGRLLGLRVLVDSYELVEQTLFLLKHHQRFKRITVTRHLGDRIPPILANDEQMIQVLMALMLSGVDSMDQGGVLTVTTRTNPVRADEVVIEIADTGHGIPAADLPKIFEPFYTTKPPGRGTGLGLSICYGIVEQHYGRIEVDSEPGRGTSFRVYLPVAIGAAA